MKKGFVIIIVVAFLAVLILIAWVIVNLGCGEIIQTKVNNDMVGVYYAAKTGAEMMFLNLRSKSAQDLTWAQLFQPISGNVQIPLTGGGTLNVGTYSANAGLIDGDEFGIISTGTVNGHSSKSIVKYFYTLNLKSAIPIGSIAPMELYGRRWLFFRSWVRAEGPLESGSTITKNEYVQVSGEIKENQIFSPISFWLGAVNDTNNDGAYLTDTNADTQITVDDAGGDPEKIAIFNADNAYSSDGLVSDKDAFYYYYTTYLNSAYSLGIGPGEANYYSGDQTFDPTSVPAGTPIIFIDGNVNITFSDTAWWGSDVDHTIVSMSDITIVQPTNGTDDTLALFAYGDVNTGGVRAFGGVRGDIVIYAHGDFNAYYGGRTDGTIFAEDNVYIDTVLPIPGLLNRDLNKGSIDWGDDTMLPLGLPPGYKENVVLFNFIIDEETAGREPSWQKN